MTDRSILFSAPAVATPDMVRAALDLVWEESKNNDELVCNIWQAMATKCQSRQSYVDCVCTKIQQDEHCLVGYPSLLCEICYGKGVVPYVKLDGPELWEIVFGIANEVAHKITDDQYTKIADAINSVFIEPAPYPALGWIYFNEDVGTEFSVDHPVESGACPDAQDIRPATAENLRDEMLSGWKAWAEDRGELDKHRNEPSSRTQALEEAAKFIDKRVSEYVQEHGVTDPETGTVEFPGWGDEYVSELEELAEGIRALSSQPVADHIADAGKMVADARQFKLGDRLTKKTGSSWTGLVVGFYSTELTPIGYAIESETEKGSVQIYPEAALRHLPASPGGSV